MPIFFRHSLYSVLLDVKITTTRNLLKAFLVGLLFFLCTPIIAHGANDLRVLVVLSENVTPYQTFASSFRENLSENIQVSVLDRAELFADSEQKVDLIVTVGIKAADWVSGKTTIPVLAAMIPSNKYAELMSRMPHARQVSAIYVDQPWTRQADLIVAALPNKKTIGLLYSTESLLDLATMRKVFVEHGLNLVAKQFKSRDSLFSDLKEVLDHSDILLAISDNTIYSNNNFRNILLTSYQKNIPLVGLSQAYVNAGALCAIFSSPQQLAEQARIAVHDFALTKHLPAPQFPASFSIAVNPDVTRSLGLPNKSVDLLHQQVEKSGVNLR